MSAPRPAPRIAPAKVTTPGLSGRPRISRGTLGEGCGAIRDSCLLGVAGRPGRPGVGARQPRAPAVARQHRPTSDGINKLRRDLD
jgi:hypothetical protein